MGMAAATEALTPVPGPMVPAPWTVLSTHRDTADTWTLELEPVAGDAMRFEPGQFTMISAFGTGEVPISISGDPGSHGGPLVHTVRAVGLATQAICEAQSGDRLSVRGPFGRPWPTAQLAGRDVLVVAGGIGLAPLRPAILSLIAERERFGRLGLLYGGRGPDQLLYPAQLESWPELGVDVAITVDAAGPEWLGHVGVVTRLIGRAEINPDRTVALLCGPEVMMRFTVAALARAGVAAENIYMSMERNMQCGIGHCGHCQLGPTLVCRDGPVYSWSELERWLAIREL
jgi:NAD(P)H-flavin reductase